MLKPIFLLTLCAAIAFTVCAAETTLVEPTSKDNSPQCQCYLTSGPDPGFFQYYRFWDFRNIANDGNDDYTTAPPLVTRSQNDGSEPITSTYFNSTTFLADWSIQTGVEERNSIIPTFNSAQNVFISRNSTAHAEPSTYLTLRAYRLPSFVSIAEIDSNQNNLLHSSIRVRARVIPNGLSNSSAPSSGSKPLKNTNTGSNVSHPVDQGAVWGFFTYHSDDQESDIEVLTYDDTSQIHYSNQPDFNYNTNDPVPDASSQVTMPNNIVWTEWADHRIDWFKGISRWYVNGQLVQNKTKNVEIDKSGLIINLWSDGGQWSGNMSVGSQVMLGIQWIEMVFNTSGPITNSAHSKRDDKIDNVSLQKRKQISCEVGCRVDGVKTIGFPETAYNVSSVAISAIRLGERNLAFSVTLAMLTALYLVFD